MIGYIIVALVILLTTVWWQSKPFYWNGCGIPFSLPVPIFGSMTDAFFNPFRTVFDNLYKGAGNQSAYGFHFFGNPALILADPELVKKITVMNADCFMDRGFHKESYDPMSKSLFFTAGEEWKTLRSKMTPSFTPSRIKAMLPIIKPIADTYSDQIGNLAKKGHVEMHTLSMKLAVDVVMATIFGLEPDAFVNLDSFFFSLQRELVSFVFGVKTLLGMFSPALYGFLGLTLLTRRTTQRLKEFVESVIDQRVKGVGNRPDFVQSMVDLMKRDEMEKGVENSVNIDGTMIARFDRPSITGQCMLMYAAGTETTGSTLSFLLYELSLNQRVQEKARKEIMTMVERTNDQYDFEDLHGLKYIEMVLKETQRKYPVQVIFSRRCTKDIDLNGIRVSKGMRVFVSTTSLHHDPRYFSDPDEFRPERFEDESSIVPGTYVPFGMGPRTCIEMRFAQTEIILALCKLLPKFKLLPSDKTEIPLKFSFNPTLSPANGIFLNLEQIK